MILDLEKMSKDEAVKAVEEFFKAKPVTKVGDENAFEKQKAASEVRSAYEEKTSARYEGQKAATVDPKAREANARKVMF